MTEQRRGDGYWPLERRVTALEGRVGVVEQRQAGDAVKLGELDAEQEAFALWRAELRGAFSLVKFALGASVVSALLGIVALIQLATETVP